MLRCGTVIAVFSISVVLLVGPSSVAAHNKDTYVRGAAGNEANEERRLADGYDHLGCFSDSRTDRIFRLQLKDKAMTTEVCFRTCTEKDAAYFATQFGHECWCSGNVRTDYDRHGVGKCDHWCGGDGSETCGGKDAFDVYAMELPEPPMQTGYIDCFKDVKSDRVLDKKIVTDDMDPDVCLKHCLKSHGTSLDYYATQYGEECWCGLSNSLGDYDRHGEGTCRTPCKGNKAIACGGYDAFDLFFYRGDGSGGGDGGGDGGETPASPAPDADSFDDLLELHNHVRCVHGADPLKMDKGVATSAQAYAKTLASDDECGAATAPHSTGLGENVFICAINNEKESCYSAEAAMNEFYYNQVGSGDPYSYGAEAMQILWKPTKDMGCGRGECVKGGMKYEILACHYSLPMNREGEKGDELERQSKGTNECHVAAGSKLGTSIEV